MDFAQSPYLVSNFNTWSCTFPATGIPEMGPYTVGFSIGSNTLPCSSRFPSHIHPTIPEQMYAIWLKSIMAGHISAHMSARAMPAPSARPPPTGPAAMSRAAPGQSLPKSAPAFASTKAAQKVSKKFGLLTDMVPNTFRDLIAHVIKIFPSTYGDYVELYVSDYTSHPLLFDYPTPEEREDVERDGDRFSYMPTPKKEWPGPWGQLVLKVEVKEPHASHVRRSIKEGDHILMQNIRLKMSRDNKLEANLYPDFKDSFKVLISHVRLGSSDEAQALIARKDQYWAKRQKRVAAEQAQSKGKKGKKARRREKLRNQQEKEAENTIAGAERNEVPDLLGRPKDLSRYGKTI